MDVHAAGTDLSVVDAALMLGLTRSQAYRWIDQGLMTAVRGHRGRMRVQMREVERLLRDPPAGSRRRRPPLAANVASLSAEVRDLSTQLAALTLAVTAGAEGQRRFHGARDALAELNGVGELYDQVLAEEATARALERQAAEHRDAAQATLRQILSAYRSAASAMVAPDDVADL
jgi:excisionase family DNA binding protein